MAKQSGKIYIGTAGWLHDTWRGEYYPNSLRQGEWLDFYTDDFKGVEITRTFDKLPSQKLLGRWFESVPRGFRFAVKASRYITHVKRLKDAKNPLQTLNAQLSPLEWARGPILFELPADMEINEARLRSFLEAHKAVAEVPTILSFTNDSWFTGDIKDVLEEYNEASNKDAGVHVCIHDKEGVDCPAWVIGNLVYIRLHGPDGDAGAEYHGNTLRMWAEKIAEWSKEGKDVYCFFGNVSNLAAVEDAKRLQELIS